MSLASEQSPKIPYGVGGGELKELTEYHIPLHMIQDEPNTYLDLERRRRLADDVAVNGQTAPIELARISGNSNLVVVNGLYRVSILRHLQGDTSTPVRATVQNMTPEEVIDTRVQSVMWHMPAELGRATQGMQAAWSRTPWADELSLRAAMGLSTSSSLERTVAIQRWLASKWNVWGIKPALARRSLEAIEGMAPDLVDSAKVASARANVPFLVVSHLQAIRDNTEPYDYTRQRAAARALLDHPLPIGMLSEFFQRADDFGDFARAASQLQEIATNRARSGQQRSAASRRGNGHRSRGGQTGAARTDGTNPASDLSASGTEESPYYFRTFGHVIFDTDQYSPSRRAEDVLRIYNLDEVNELSREWAQQMGREPNELEIGTDGRVVINGDEEVLSGSLHMEMLNVLLASYMCTPTPSIRDLHVTYGFASRQPNSMLSMRMLPLHKALTRWRFQGLVGYNPQTAHGAALLPILIRDRRVFH